MSRNDQSRRSFLKSAGAGALAFGLAGSARADSSNDGRPNIVFMMSDDHAATAVGCYGKRLSKLARTPHIDRIAREGVRLENCFCTNSICAPSRGSVLTGQYSHVHGVTNNSSLMREESPSVAELLRQSGYQTALIGKWHIGRFPNRTVSQEPPGFDHWEVLPGQGRYHNPLMIRKDGKKTRHKGYSSDVIGDLSIDWMKDRDPDRPFMLMCHFKSCHEPYDWPGRHAALYEDTHVPEPDSLFEEKIPHAPKASDFTQGMMIQQGRFARKNWPTGTLDTRDMQHEKAKRAVYQKLTKDYLRAIAAIDENVGRMLDYLEQAGLADNTLVIYTTDQGYFLGEHGLKDKRFMYEEALRMPFVARLPGRIPAGSVNKEMILNVDYAPTFLDYAGLETPGEMQGQSVRRYLEGREASGLRDAMYYHYWPVGHWMSPAQYGIRTRRYKLMFCYGLWMPGAPDRNIPSEYKGWELYDLQKDPAEVHNVYGKPEYAKVQQELKRHLQKLKQDLGDTDTGHREIMKVREEYWS